jgi:hypothetical protein
MIKSLIQAAVGSYPCSLSAGSAGTGASRRRARGFVTDLADGIGAQLRTGRPRPLKRAGDRRH